MKSTLLMIALAFVAIPLGVAQNPDGFALPAPRLYELYSWPQSSHVWNFCLLPSPSGVNIAAETIFNKKLRLTGVEQLKKKIALLPTDTTILWMNGITSAQTPTAESKKLALPPMETVEQVKRYAEGRGVHVQVPRSSPDLRRNLTSGFQYVNRPFASTRFWRDALVAVLWTPRTEYKKQHPTCSPAYPTTIDFF